MINGETFPCILFVRNTNKWYIQRKPLTYAFSKGNVYGHELWSLSLHVDAATNTGVPSAGFSTIYFGEGNLLPSTIVWGSKRHRILVERRIFCSGLVASWRPSTVTRGGSGFMESCDFTHAPAMTGGGRGIPYSTTPESSSWGAIAACTGQPSRIWVEEYGKEYVMCFLFQ